MAVGSLATSGNRYYDTPQTIIYQQPAQPSASEVQARADAEAARRAAEQAALAAEQAQQAAVMQNAQPGGPRPGLMLVKVRVPVGVTPGNLFTFSVNGRPYSIKCPAGAYGGQEILVYVPAVPDEVPVQADATNVADVGKRVLREALNVDSSTSPQQTAILIKDHIIDEQAVENVEHGIVAGKKGDIVRILDGTIDGGMAPPYGEYCTVRFGNGKIGKVSRFLLQPYGINAPPRAQT